MVQLDSGFSLQRAQRHTKDEKVSACMYKRSSLGCTVYDENC